MRKILLLNHLPETLRRHPILNCATTNACVTLLLYTGVPPTQTFQFTTSGTFSATLAFEKSYDNGATWSLIQSTIYANSWVFTIPNVTQVRVRASAFTSGDVHVVIQTLPSIQGFYPQARPGAPTGLPCTPNAPDLSQTLYRDVVGYQWWQCSATNTWTLFGGPGGSAAPPYFSYQFNQQGPFGGANSFYNPGTSESFNPYNVYFGGGTPYFDVKAFCASGSQTQTTGTISAGGTALTIASAIDFVNCPPLSGEPGQGIRIYHAGAAPTVAAPTGVTVTPVGTTGSTTYSYEIVANDYYGGASASHYCGHHYYRQRHPIEHQLQQHLFHHKFWWSNQRRFQLHYLSHCWPFLRPDHYFRLYASEPDLLLP